MSTILVINSSVRRADSHSRQLVEDVVNHLRSKDQHTSVTYRDLASNPLPHFDAAAFEGLRGAGKTEDGQAAIALSDTLITELKNHDTIILGVPMYNFTIPSTLKAWIDYIVRVGVTFRYGENGPEGFIQGKKVYVVSTRGGVPANSPLDHLQPYLKTVLDIIGLDDVTFINAPGVDRENGQETLIQVREDIRNL